MQGGGEDVAVDCLCTDRSTWSIAQDRRRQHLSCFESASASPSLVTRSPQLFICSIHHHIHLWAVALLPSLTFRRFWV